MNAKKIYYTLFLLLITRALAGAPLDSPAVQEIRLSLEQMSYQLHSHAVDINLFQERVNKLEEVCHTLKQELKASLLEKTLEKRVATLERANESFVHDFKTLKAHLNETNTTLAQCQSQLTKIDKQLSSDIQSLKTSLGAMLALLQLSPTDQRTYIVQTGDSLGLIALNYKTDIATLKKLNNLSSDTIYSGQKLILP